jgi:hypothetical protein
MFPYDAALLAAVQTVPQSVPEVVSTLQHIQSICDDGDGLKWFNGLYLDVTQAVQARVVARGFADPAWIASLDVHFARLYLSAVKGALSGHGAPACWQRLMESRHQQAVTRIQFALAGMNAHINHDLPAAIVATCQATGTSPAHGGVHYRDYTAVDSTLHSLVDEAKQMLQLRLPGDAIPEMSHLHDTIAAWNVDAARESAWQVSEHLWNIRSLPALASSVLNTVDGLTCVINKVLLVPVPLAAALA